MSDSNIKQQTVETTIAQVEEPSPREEPSEDTPPKDEVAPIEPPAVKARPGVRSDGDRKKDEDKSSVYKAMAIKLKKELVKSRDELAKVKEELTKTRDSLQSRLETLEGECNINSNLNATLEATIKNLRNQIESYERDLGSIQEEFENYKTKASQIIKQNNPSLVSNNNFDEQRYKQLKELNEEQKSLVKGLQASNIKLEQEVRTLQRQNISLRGEIETCKQSESRCHSLERDNEKLRSTLEQYQMKLGLRVLGREDGGGGGDDNDNKPVRPNNSIGPSQPAQELSGFEEKPSPEAVTVISCDVSDQTDDKMRFQNVQEDSNTNSSSSFDGSTTSGYVHIKPATFEIISRTSVLEDAQNQIDNLTKAYLDSESTNSLLSEQVKALKEEIRRIQRGTERMDLAENLEYLKNVVFKFLALDSSQIEQRQRLVPVLTAVLKLSPDETAKLSSIATADWSSKAGSLFKL